MTTRETPTYSPAVAELLAQSVPNPLVPTRPVEAMRAKLAALDDAELFGGERVVDRDMADACLSGLWLRFDFLDESHTISQSVDTTTGSYWHGIMHRREPDYSNAKYWFARVRQHPIEGELTAAVQRIAGAPLDHWNHAKFVDLCERAARERGELENACRQLQLIEWQMLFDYCYRQAIGQT